MISAQDKHTTNLSVPGHIKRLSKRSRQCAKVERASRQAYTDTIFPHATQAYKYTNQSGCYDRRDGVTDKEIFDELMQAFDTMGVTAMQYGGCFDVIAATLAIGNIEFADIPGAADDAAKAEVTGASKPSLATAARLLGSDEGRIITALTSRQVTAGLNHQVPIAHVAE